MDDAYENGNGRGGASRGNSAATRSPKLKYMKMLQDVADRKKSQVLIDLDDLDAVGGPKILASTNMSFALHGHLLTVSATV